MVFDATIAFVDRFAVVTLTNADGQWAGGGTVTVASGKRDDLYVEGWRLAAFTAQAKGGRLDRYRVAPSV